MGPARSFVTVDAGYDGQRLDNFLLSRLKGVPRSHVYRIVRRGEVRVNSARARPDTRLKTGDKVRIPPLRASQRPIDNYVDSASAFNFPVLAEDDSILVLDKPAGVAVHGGSTIAAGLIEIVRAQRPELATISLVHRLDRDTSGCLLLAKNRGALVTLHAQLRGYGPRPVVKKYLALVAGRWDIDRRMVTAPLIRRTDSARGHRVLVDPHGMPASTSIRVADSNLPGATLVEVQLHTGRTHQARVHMAHHGHPIAADPRYGDADFNRRMAAFGLKRLFLHASELQFRHPASGEYVRIAAPLPEELNAPLSRLRDCVAAVESV